MDFILTEDTQRFAGVRRSGNHAVIDWILGHYENWTHYNNVVYRSPDKISTDQWSISSSGDFKLASFEDYPLKHLPWGDRILLLRDPFNTFASRLQHFRNTVNDTTQFENWQDFSDFYSNLNLISSGAMNIWKQYAHAYLKGEFVILFNKWYSDKDYRIEISERLGLDHTDAGFKSKKGHEFSRGSSFKNFDPLNSWQNLQEDAEYLSLFDKETIFLSLQIFGEPPELPFGYINTPALENAIEAAVSLCFEGQTEMAGQIVEQAEKVFPESTRLLHIKNLLAYI